MNHLYKHVLLLALGMPLLIGCGRTSAVERSGTTDRTTEAERIVTAGSASNTVVQNLQAIPDLSRFAQAVQAAQLDGTLGGSESYTIFAPSNEAFETLPGGNFDDLLAGDAERLEYIVRSHIAEGDMRYDDLSEGETIVMLSGEAFNVARQATDRLEKRIQDASIVVADIESTNGVIHVINLVLDPDPGGF